MFPPSLFIYYARNIVTGQIPRFDLQC